MKFRKKPVFIEAFEWITGEKEPHFIRQAFREGVIERVKIQNLGNTFIETLNQSGVTALKIKTLEGYMYALEGDFVIKGVEDELYSCKPDIFWKTYSFVGEDNGETDS